MGLNDTPSANRVHLGFFGLRNAGKSSLANAVAGQELAVVSEIRGTTTDPVYKAMELLPMGPVMVIDTPGMDDEGSLGTLRVRKAKQVLNKTDVAVLVVDATMGKTAGDEELIGIFIDKKIPYVVAYNKCDLLEIVPDTINDGLYVSATTKFQIHELKEKIAALAVTEESKRKLVGDLLEPSDFVVLVVPIDSAAPKGRLILPQQQTIRDVLETGATAVVVREHEFRETLESLGKRPRIVITDSQAFAKVSAEAPPDILLTSFSILFARYKGSLIPAVRGAKALDGLAEDDPILISEGCTHHRQCDDIGTVKLPRWIRDYKGKPMKFVFTSGTEFPDDLSPFKLIVHCGGCMLNEREMKYRVKCASDQHVPITNYGILIASMQGILKRTLAPFPDILAELGDGPPSATTGRSSPMEA